MSQDTALPTREKKPTFLKGVVFILLLVIISIGLAYAAMSQRSATGALIPDVAPVALSVEVKEVQLADTLTLDETFSGIVTAKRTSQLGFSGGGRIISIRADVGDSVRAGQVLAELDTRDLRASLGAAEASIAEAKANYALAENTVGRQRTLLERGHVSQQRLDEAEAQAAAADARIEAAMAQADSLRVAIDLAAIKAPFSGVVTNRMGDEGLIAMPGAPLLELVEADQLEARIGLPASVAANMQVGETYQLSSGAGTVPAVLRAKTGVIDRNLRTMISVFDISEAGSVEAGALVRLALPRDIQERGFWAPVSALSESSRGLWSLYLVKSVDGGYEAQPSLVEIIHSDGDRVFVRGAVSHGDLYISNGLARLVPGQRVSPRIAASAVNTSGEG